MRSEDLSRVIDAFGPSDAQKQRMFNQIIGHSSNQGRRRGRMAKVMILAVAIALFSGTAFALSTTELFKEIFGSSIDLVEEQILSPMESVADDQFRLTLEGILSDAYSSTAIVSVEALAEKSRQELEHISSRLQVKPIQDQIRANHSIVVELKHLSEKNTKRFMVGFSSQDGPLTGDLEVSLTTDQSQLTLSAPTVSTIPTMTIRLDEEHYASADYVPQTVLISPLSVVVIGYERTVNYQIPHPRVILHFANGTVVDVFNQETGFGGSRFPEEGLTTVSAPFENIIDLDQLQFITVDGKEYQAGDID
jgi:hypothetical protein